MAGRARGGREEEEEGGSEYGCAKFEHRGHGLQSRKAGGGGGPGRAWGRRAFDECQGVSRCACGAIGAGAGTRRARRRSWTTDQLRGVLALPRTADCEPSSQSLPSFLLLIFLLLPTLGPAQRDRPHAQAPRTASSSHTRARAHTHCLWAGISDADDAARGLLVHELEHAHLDALRLDGGGVRTGAAHRDR
jgi:hypothetical protein